MFTPLEMGSKAAAKALEKAAKALEDVAAKQAKAIKKDAEKKVYRVLMEQIWNAFPSYCRGAWDIRQVSSVSQFRVTTLTIQNTNTDVRLDA